MRFKDHIDEASANVAIEKFDELHDILMKTDDKDKLKEAENIWHALGECVLRKKPLKSFNKQFNY